MKSIKNTRAKIAHYLRYLTVVLMVSLLYTDFAFADSKEFADAWNGLFGEFQVIIGAVAGIGTLTSFLVFIIHMMKLATEGGQHPIFRARILKDIVISGVCTALLGAVSLIYVLIYQTAFFG